MTTWDKIYQDYQKGGEAWATLDEKIMPEFISFVNTAAFSIKNALDIGCGTGLYLAFLKEQGFSVTGIDSSKTAVAMSSKRLGPDAQIFCADMFAYQPPKNSFDFIYSLSTIHHGPKDQVTAAIHTIYEALIPTGKIFITLPDAKESMLHQTFKDHQNLGDNSFVPLSGPEKGLIHSFFSKTEIKTMFKDYHDIQLQLDQLGRWIVTGMKK